MLLFVRKLLPLAFAALAGLLVASATRAHPFSMSASRVWVHDDRVSLALHLDGFTLVQLFQHELDENGDGAVTFEELRGKTEFLQRYLWSKVEVASGGEPCRPQGMLALAAATGERLYAWLEVRCRTPWTTLSLKNSVFMEDEGGHRIHSEVRLAGRVERHVFTPSSQYLVLRAEGADTVVDPEGSRWFPARDGAVAAATTPPTEDTSPDRSSGGKLETFFEFVEQGVVHVLFGWDHVAFLVAVLLVVRSLRELLLIVTSFTIAHSLTLALGALGWVTPSTRWVESLIALSIVYVAVENILREHPPERYTLTFAFGLIHGFGFSSALREVGLSQSSAALSLFSFNLGVELGQLLLVLPLFPVGIWLSRKKASGTVRRTVSGGIAVMGVVWFIERAFALDVPIAGA